MQSAITQKATVQESGRIEITDPQLLAGNVVDVIILFSENGAACTHSISDVLASTPGQLAFEFVKDVESYLREERDAWAR